MTFRTMAFCTAGAQFWDSEFLFWWSNSPGYSFHSQAQLPVPTLLRASMEPLTYEQAWSHWPMSEHGATDLWQTLGSEEGLGFYCQWTVSDNNCTGPGKRQDSYSNWYQSVGVQAHGRSYTWLLPKSWLWPPQSLKPWFLKDPKGSLFQKQNARMF